MILDEEIVKMKSYTNIVIIGAGIAGLSAGIYAQMSGFQSAIYEMHSLPGGLVTSWKRKGYTIDGCIHWLTGSSPLYPGMYKQWQEIGLIQDRELFNPEIFCRIEDKNGKVFNLYTNVDKLEAHMLELAPRDAGRFNPFAESIRIFSKFNVQQEESPSKLTALLNNLAAIVEFIKWGPMTLGQFSTKFSDPFLKNIFTSLWEPRMAALGLPYTLAMLNNKSAAYPIGGSFPMSEAVEKRYLSLGGEIHYDCRVKKILVEKDQAVGVELENGEIIKADHVISAADGYNTIFKMLDGRYVNDEIKKKYSVSTLFERSCLWAWV
jgi:phytoene dehydrogenase-like protein